MDEFVVGWGVNESLWIVWYYVVCGEVVLDLLGFEFGLDCIRVVSVFELYEKKWLGMMGGN